MNHREALAKIDPASRRSPRYMEIEQRYLGNTMTVLNHRMRTELIDMLESRRFDFFISLATNFASLTRPQMRDALKKWDARVNRDLNGPAWEKRPDERMLWFAFLEKADINPHWHLVVQLDDLFTSTTRQARYKRFSEFGRNHWLRLVPSGSFDCQTLASDGIFGYVTKELRTDANWQDMISSREFQTS